MRSHHDFSAPQNVQSARNMLALKNISQSFGTRKVLNDVSLVVPSGSLMGLIGPSGGGKSVLLKIIAGIMVPDTGAVEVAVEQRSQISLMFQAGALFDSINVLDNVAFPLVDGRVPISRLSHHEKCEITERVDTILRRVGLSKAAHKLPAQLSGGMKRRVSLARAVIARPKLVLLDDPTFGLDPVASGIIMDLIVELHKEYKPTMLIVSQDLRRLLPVVDNIFGLFDGSIQFDGSLSELKSRALPEIQRFVGCRFDLGLGAAAR